MIRTHLAGGRRVATVVIVVSLLVSSVGLAGSVAAADAPVVEQGPVEFRALDSGDNHVEVVFEGPIATDNYTFAVVDGSGETVADNDDINEGLTDEAVGRVVFDLGTTDLSGDAVLRVEAANVSREFPVTTTAAFVQEGAENEEAIQPGETLALVDIYGSDSYYEISTGSGDVVANGTLGTHSYITAVDTQDWEENATYTVQFGEMSVVREVAVVPANDGGSGATTADRPEPTAELRVHKSSLSATNVTVDETVTVTATFENVGNASGTFTAWVADSDLDRLADRTVTDVGIDDRRQVRVPVTFDRAGTYTLLLSGRPVGEVTVHNPDRARFNERYPHLEYRVWDSMMDEGTSDTASTTDDE